MIDINNTATNGYVLCSECSFNGLECCYKGTAVPNGVYYCLLRDVAVENVGVCRDFIERKELSDSEVKKND